MMIHPSILFRCLSFSVYAFMILCITISSSQAQTTASGSVTGNISFRNPSPSCTIRSGADLSFGTLEKPITGTLSVTVDADDGRITTNPTGHSVQGHTVGSFSVSGAHVNSYTITHSPGPLPAILVSETKSSDTISLSTVARVSYDGGTTWTSPSTRCFGSPCLERLDTGSGGGVFSSFSQDYQIGGTITGIQLSTPEATYSTSITFSISCS